MQQQDLVRSRIISVTSKCVHDFQKLDGRRGARPGQRIAHSLLLVETEGTTTRVRVVKRGCGGSKTRGDEGPLTYGRGPGFSKCQSCTWPDPRDVAVNIFVSFASAVSLELWPVSSMGDEEAVKSSLWWMLPRQLVKTASIWASGNLT